MAEALAADGPRRAADARPAAAALTTRQALALLAIFGAGLALRIPRLINAAAYLSSDEAVDALFMRHLVAGRELALHPWSVSYYGIVEGLLALPFAAVLGLTPLAWKLGAVVGFLALQYGVFRLGRQLYGTNEGIAAALLLAAFSPQLVSWSTLAAGGIVLVVGWGTLTLCRLQTLWRDPSSWRAASLGFMIGFGLYIYELYVVYVVALAIWALAACWAARRWSPRYAALIALGMAVGAAPKAAPLLQGAAVGKAPMYRLASLDVMAANLRLLVHECVPALFGVQTSGHPEPAWMMGPHWPGADLAGTLLLAAYAAAWLWGAKSALRRGLAGPESLLVLLVPVAACLFVASPNPQSVFSLRYLLPWLSSLPVFMGAVLVRVARRSKPAVAALVLLLVALPAAQIVAWYREDGLLDSRLRPVRKHVWIADVMTYLESHGFQGAYGWYWIAYQATLLSGERTIVAPLDDWDRYPPYTRFVGKLRRVAYVFDLEPQMVAADAAQARRRLADFHNRLESAGASWEEVRIGHYLILHGKGGERLLPPNDPADPVALRAPRAEVAPGAVPPRARAGEWLRIPVRFTNRSDAFWSATGLPLAAGSLRVTAAYRWFDPSGRVAVEYGERSLLPRDVRPGETLPMIVRVLTPERPGPFDLAITLVQDNVAWFDQATGSASPRRRVEVGGPAAPPGRH